MGCSIDEINQKAMTRNLRKRHLIIWFVMAVLISMLMVMARTNIPVFNGDQSVEQGR